MDNVLCDHGELFRKIQWISIGSVSPTRGLRQGDPLSPFLFLLVADGLSALLQSEISNGGVSPIKLCRRARGISHLLFADDTLIFFKANQDQAGRVKGVIDAYAAATGQLINESKCSILFSTGCSEGVQEVVRGVLEVQKNEFEDKYLGLPTPDGRMTKDKFEELQAKLVKQLMMG
jgi:hypothetical protein